MKKVLAILFCIFLFAQTGYSSTLENVKEARKLADSIMSDIGGGNFKTGFNKMKPYVIIPANEFDSAYLSSQAQRDQFASRFGQTIGYEFIGTKKVGESLVLIQYIEKTTKHAFPWSFYFYKNENGWILNSFNWNDDFKPLFMIH